MKFPNLNPFARHRVASPASAALPVAQPRVTDFTPLMWAGRRMTPDQVRLIIEGAVAGNIQEQWALFDMMEDTWPRLAKNLSEVRRSAARAALAVQPYASRGEQPTDQARARADLTECALRNWRPRPGTLELGFEDALYHALDCIGKGLAVLEITWQRHEEGLIPRCAHLLHPSKYGWNAEGTELGLVNCGSGIPDTGYSGQSIGPGQGSDSRFSYPVSGIRNPQSASWQPFPPGQFWVCVWHGRSGVPGQTALLRSLAPYWCGVTFGWEWLLNHAQIFGVPLRWATYDASQPQLLGQLSTMLQNLGSAGWAAFPQGTTLDFKEAVSRATDNPQVVLQELANKYCDQLILGQEASGSSQPAGLGSGASQLHGSVRDGRLQDAAQFCADLLNYQLIPALLRWNWGDECEPPIVTVDEAGETDPKAKAERDQVLVNLGLPISLKYLYDRHAIPPPEAGEPVIGDTGNRIPNTGKPDPSS